MTDVWGALAQTSPVATTLTDSYTCPVGKHVTLQVIACNTGGAAATIRVSHAVKGIADDIKQYILYGKSVATGDTVVTARVTLAGGDVLRVYSSLATVTFNVNGIEESNS